jgi:hypothetical protein
MEEPRKVTILKWIMDLIDERGGAGLAGLTADEVEARIRDDQDLTDAQKDVLLSRDPVRIRAVVEYELAYKLDEYMIHTTPFYFVLPIPIHF